MTQLMRPAPHRCVVTTSSYTADEDFSVADAIFPEIGDEGSENFSLGDLTTPGSFWVNAPHPGVLPRTACHHAYRSNISLSRTRTSTAASALCRRYSRQCMLLIIRCMGGAQLTKMATGLDDNHSACTGFDSDVAKQ